ncbi:uncharacterized protein LOC135347305 isoform X2 [Halichondria panicea]|uniref:uncharacterized protein LOC135347305 isoform X2 n=1 Tax=Halichondria panicea TaxID=6063 RepID=UPI00312BB6F0
MQWILRSSAARSFEGKWSPKIRQPICNDYPEDLEDNVTLVFRKPSWQLRASLASVLITPVLYQLYLIMVTIRYILFLQTFSSPPHPACPVVDLSWTGVFPCELGWRGSALVVLILSAVLITCYSLITACLVRWNPRKQWNIQYCTTLVFDTQEKPTKFQVRVQSTNGLMLPPTLSLCILLLIFRLLLQSGDVEANPGPTLGSILMLSDLNSVYEKLIEAAGNWFNLGLALGLGHGTLDDIKDDYHRNKDCLREMIVARLKTGPLTYFEICQSLSAPTVDRNDVAEAIEEACTVDDTSPGSSVRPTLCTTTPEPTKPKSDNHSTIQQDEAIGIYRSYLTSIYDTRSLPADDKYPLQCIKHFVNLECVDVSKHLSRKDIEESWSKIVQGELPVNRFPRERITMDQLASKVEGKFSKLVVIKGAPGGGKTTLSWELCRRWANGDFWRDYSLVILLRLRDKNVQEAVELVDLFQCENTDASTSIVATTTIQNHHGRGILFILEGLDELPPSLREKKSMFMKLITGRLLPASTVLVTTRPWAVCDLPVTCSSRVDQFIEILGFSSKQIQEYIDLMIKDGKAPPELREYIDSNPQISSAMYNPLYARIVVEIYQECHDKDCHDKKSNSIFPNTTTELYTTYSQILIERYLHENPVYLDSDWSGELSELPSSLQVHFDKLCRIAYKGITKEKQQLVFFKEDVVDASTTLGFMNSVHPLHKFTNKSNGSPSYNFLHLTLQEFLAAFHIWRTYPQQKQLQFIETHSEKYNMIILFLVGLTKLSDDWTKCILPAPRVRSSDNELVIYLNREHILWLYETQNKQLISSFENVVLPMKLIQSGLDPLYFLALGYCIAVGKFMLEIKVRFANKKLMEDQNHLHFMAGLKRDKCSSQIKFLDILWGKHPFPDSLYKLFNYVPDAKQGVLRVYNAGCNPMASRFSQFLISQLNIQHNIENIPSSNSLNSLKVINYFITLKILHCHIDDSNMPIIMNETIPLFYTSLEYMEVRIAISVDDRHDEESEQYLLFGLNIKRFKELKRCQLFPSNFGPICTGDFIEQANKFTDHFADFLKYFALFTGYSRLPTFIIKRLVCHSLSKCPLLEKLTIDFISPDPIAASGQDLTLQNLDSIFTALKENSSVRELSCKIKVGFTSNEIIDHFCTKLQQNTSLEEIDLEVLNRLSDPKLEQIMETVCRPTLKKFVIRINFHSPVIANNDTIVAICNVLENNENLEYLHLPTMCVKPDQRFLLPIAKALSKNSSLTTLILEFKLTEESLELYTSEDIKAVGDMLEENKALRFLHLMVDIPNPNSKTNPDWSPIIEGLKLNETIEELHIPLSARGSAIKCIDYVHVRSRIKFAVVYEIHEMSSTDEGYPSSISNQPLPYNMAETTRESQSLTMQQTPYYNTSDTRASIEEESKPSTIIGVKRKKEDKKDESGRPTLGSILTLDDLGSVNEKLIKVAGNWKELGLALGLHSGTLKNIEQDYRKSKDYLREMLTVCLETANLTYSKICQSLRAPAVRQDALADAIKEEFTDDDTLPGPSKRQQLSSGPTMQ